MNVLFSVLSILVTVLVYEGCKKIYSRLHFVIFSPILICPILLILLLVVFHTSYTTYENGAKWLTFLLGPATVAFAVPMYEHIHLLKKHGIEILLSVIVGSCIAILSSLFFSLWVHLSSQVINSMIPRSITTPIAMDVSKLIGGVPTMTAVFVIITGVTGSVIGPLILRYFPIRTLLAKGMMFGMGAHG